VGANWFRTQGGKVLHKLADEVDPAKTAFDWGPLHALLSKLPPGSWTTYGALAGVVGTSPQPLGGHLASCHSCVNAHRVLGQDGKSRPNFRRTDPNDTRSQAELLIEEGIPFTNGVADPARRLDADHLHALLSPEAQRAEV
jgi:alkylated DNA nucleotide flippase Atl1